MTQLGNHIEQHKAPDAPQAIGRAPLLPQFVRRIPPRVLTAALLCCAALGFNLYRLGDPGVWFDEAFSVELARQPLPLLWRIIFGPEPNMELYYLFLHFWLGLTSWLGLNPTEFVVRFPSAIFAALATPVVFLLGQRFISAGAGIVAASLYLLNALQLTYAQQARSYSLQLLLLCIAWYALLSALTSTAHARRWWACYVMAMALAIYAHLFSLLIVLAQVGAMGGLLLLPCVWRERARKQCTAFVVALLIIALLSVPMGLEAFHGAKTGWLAVPDPYDLALLLYTISGYNRPYLIAMALVCTAGAGAVLYAYFSRGRDIMINDNHSMHIIAPSMHGTGQSTRDTSRGHTKDPYHAKNDGLQRFFPITLALLCWLVIPVAVSYSISQGALRLFSSRYLVTIVPPLCLLMALSAAALPRRTLRAVLACCLIALALSAVPMYYRSAQVEDWNSTTHWLEQHYQAGDGLVCFDNTMQPGVQQGCQIAVEYYLHAYPSGAHFTPDSPGAFSWTTFGPVDPRAGYDAAVDPAALAAYGAQHPRLFYIIGRVRDAAAAARARAALRWLDSRYRLLGQITTRTVTIRLYATGAP